MRLFAILVSALITLGFASDAFACGNVMWRTDPTVHNNILMAWHLKRGENREVLKKAPFRYRRAAVEMWAKSIESGEEFKNAKRKRVVLLMTAAVVRSEGMWARTDKAEPLDELGARANLEWAVEVLEQLATDSYEARAYLIEGRYRLDGDGLKAAIGLSALAASDELPDGFSWKLLAQLTRQDPVGVEAESKAETMLASAQEEPRPKNQSTYVGRRRSKPPRSKSPPRDVINLF